MKKATLELMVDDIEKSVEFYTNVLGFEKNFEVPERHPVFVSISNGNVDIMLYTREEFSKEIPKFRDIGLGGSFALYIAIDKIQAFYSSIKDKINIIQELHITDYGSTEFSMEDPDGYILMFSQSE